MTVEAAAQPARNARRSALPRVRLRAGLGARLYVWVVLAFLMAPLVLCVLFSFTAGPNAAFPIPGLGLDWYRRISANPQFWAAAATTAQIAGGCALAATLVGLSAAFGLSRLPPRLAMMGLALLCLPVMLPPLMLGMALLSFFNMLGLKTGVLPTILAHLVFTLPLVTAVIYARLATLDQSVLEAAYDLGASPLGAFLRITLPALSPTLVGAFLIAVALSLDDFVIAFFTTSSNTLSTLIWGMMRTTINPTINAVGTAVIVITIGMTALALRITRFRG